MALLLYLLLFSGPTFLMICDAVPTSYDQRQDGTTNIDTRLDNLLFLFAFPRDLNLVDSLTSLPSIDLVSFKNAAKSRETSSETEAPAVYETEDGQRGRVPYRMEMIHMEKDGETENVEKKSKNEAQNEKEDKQKGSSEKQTRSLWRREGRKLEGLEKEKEKFSNEMETLEEFKDLYDKTNSKRKKSGTILKDMFFKKGMVEISLIPGEKTDETGREKLQELKLLGGGIENCGPGRYRDQSGICEFDKNFN